MNPILALVLFVVVAIIVIAIAAKLIVLAVVVGACVLIYFGAERLIGRGGRRG